MPRHEGSGGNSGTLYGGFATAFETAGRFTIAGNGSVAFGAKGLRLQSSATQNRYETATADLALDVGVAFGKDMMFFAHVVLATLPTDGSSFFGVARALTVAGTGHTYNSVDQFGFKLILVSGTPTLYATNSNGATETATDTGITVASIDNLRLACVFTAGTDIKFYVAQEDGTSTLVATHTTNLPTSAHTNPIFCSVANDNVATNFDCYVGFAETKFKIV